MQVEQFLPIILLSLGLFLRSDKIFAATEIPELAIPQDISRRRMSFPNWTTNGLVAGPVCKIT